MNFELMTARNQLAACQVENVINRLIKLHTTIKARPADNEESESLRKSIELLVETSECLNRMLESFTAESSSKDGAA